MTLVTAPPPVPEAVTTRLARRWSRARWVVGVALAVFLSALAVALTTGRGAGGDLDPGSTGPGGGRAVAEILRSEGVDVVRVTRSTDAARLADGDSTLLVVNTKVLRPDQLERVRGSAAPVVVLVDPDQIVLRPLAPGVRAAGIRQTEVRSPGCDDPGARAAGDVMAGSHIYLVAPETAEPGTTVCYPDDEQPRAGSYVVAPVGPREVRVVGQPRILQNRYLADEGNAALALRTLGSRARLVWYVPDPLEPVTGAGGGAGGPGGGQGGGTQADERRSLLSLLPPWVGPVTLQLLVAALVAIVWRARRLGRLVPEPLPVVVRAAENEEGRARLYRQAGARGRAAATLRTAALRRLATRLAVDQDTTPEHVATLIARATGRPHPEVREILLGTAPHDDGALVALADQLDTLERQVATTPHGTAGRTGRTQQP
jgi:Domain of unknown function (DUF4350)